MTPGLVSVLSVAENVSVSLRARGWSPGDADDEALAALARAGLAHLADLLPHELDDEQVDRVVAARASVVGPDDLLDEDVRDVPPDPSEPAADDEPADHSAFRRPGS